MEGVGSRGVGIGEQEGGNQFVIIPELDLVKLGNYFTLDQTQNGVTGIGSSTLTNPIMCSRGR